MRQFVIFLAALFRLVQIFYHLHLIRISREPFSRRIRPPLVIKALLDMKGESLGATKVKPLTLGMLERLEGIVKVRDQQKFNVRSGREYLIGGVIILLFFSFAQWTWEFTKVLTADDRRLTGKYFTPDVDAIPAEWKLVGQQDYSKENMFLDFTTLWCNERS